jgi:phosphoglycolate phosphatase
MKKRFSAVIFDCDGVMFDSRRANLHFYNHLLARFNLPPMRDEDVSVVHMRTAEESVRHIFQGTPYEEEAQAYRLTMDYTPFIQDMILEPGLRDLLHLLKPRHGLAVATNRSTTIGQVLESFGLSSFFDIVVSSLDVQRPKPHPEPLLKILDFFGISPEASLYIGDSPIDGQTAVAAGVPFVAYKNPNLQAEYHTADLMEIAAITDGHDPGKDASASTHERP